MSKFFSVTYGKAIMYGIGAPYTSQNDLFLRAWADSEAGDSTHPGAVWNPFDSTQVAPGSTDYNANHPPVQNYANWQSGVDTTVKTLLNGHYPGLVDALRNGSSAVKSAVALAGTPWGTGKLVQQVLLSNSTTWFPIGNCYPTIPAPYAHGSLKIHPGDTGHDVDELLRHLGNADAWYTKLDVGNPVAKVIAIQKANPKTLGTADGVVGPVTYKFITGHA